ncbi:MAG: MotA/TolQ/ExbB proton channel family protein [Pseudomonadota bacterium]
MLKKLTSVLILALALGGQHFLVSSAFAQDATAPVEEAAPAVDPSVAAPAETPAEAPAPEATDDAANVLAAADAEENAKEQFTLGALWAGHNGVPDWVARSVLILMLIMSAATWYLTAVKLLAQSSLNSQAKEARKVWDAKSLKEGVNNLKPNSAYRAIAEDGMNAVKSHEGKTDKIDLESWVSMSIQRSVSNVTNELQTGMAVLATVASASPFVGLFGTVYGIYHALIAIAISGQASIDKVAGPVGEALIMTAIGLAVAVPAVFFYNWLIRRNKVTAENLHHFAADVHAYLVLGIPGGK